MPSGPELHVLSDAVAVVRSRPEMYLAAGVTPEHIADALAHCARVLGASRVLIETFDSWTIVLADVDWLQIGRRPTTSPYDLFFRIAPFPEDSVNAMRTEILATAFASHVISASPADRFVVSGDVADRAPIWRALEREGFCRGIAFRDVATTAG